MRRIDRLKRDTRKAAIGRGHSMGIFYTVARPNPTMGVHGRVAVAECSACGAWARVDIRPAHNGSEIAGNAVAIECDILTRNEIRPPKPIAL